MIKYRTKLIEKLTHGRAVSHMLKTIGGMVKPPDVVTCFGSYKVNTRPLIDWQAPSSDESRRQIRLHFTYSRNNGPIQRVMIDENTEDWDAIDLLYSKLDSDLCRAQDGESLAFYLLSDGMGVMEQVIPDLNDIHMPPVLIPPIEATRMVMSNVPAQPNYDYTITGIGGDGLIPIKGVFNVDARKIAIPQPVSDLDLNDVTSSYPRWYPNNDIVKEDNIIVIYPSDNTDDFDFDLFKALGGVGNTPITINSCVKAVPRKYFCEASHVVGSQVSSLMLTRLALSRSDASVNSNREPVRFSDAPFPFKAASWNGDYVTWPPSMRDESGTREYDWIASYRRNDGPLKVITWNTGSRKPGSQHSVWDAIKELLLDDYGRTAFMLSDFNSTASSYNDDGDVTVKSGIGSNLNFTIKPPEEGEPLHRSNQPYRYSGKSVEVRDRQIQFSDENAGAVWNENTITIYPTPWEVINDYGFDGQSDYYEYLCQYYDQIEAGEPITIHSCAAVEPTDHIQVNTGFKIDMSVMGEVMPPGLIARVQINDGEIKEFANEGELMEKTIADLLNYVSLLGANPIVTSSSGMGDDSISYARAQSKTNLLYFKTTIFDSEPAIAGCSGIERPNETRMELMNIDMEAQKMEMLQVEILDDMDSDIPHVRGSNKVTFHRAVGSEYVDFFDLIVGAKGDTHTIYSSAGVPCLLLGNPLDGGGEEPDDSNLPDGIPLRFTVNNPDNPSGDMPFKVELIAFNPDYTWSIYKDGELLVDANNNPEDIDVGVNNYFGDKPTYTTKIFLPMQRNTINEYRVYSDASRVEITSNGKSDEINPRAITVIEFSDSITEHLFPSNYILFTVPNELPSYLRSTKSMFFNNKLFNQDISTWDTSNIVDMSSMFCYASSFNQDISEWNVSNVTNMDNMFDGAASFNQDLSSWCVSNIPSAARGFIAATDSWILPKPVWGTCPPAGVLTEPEIPLTFNVDTDVSIKINVSDVSTGDWKLFKNDVLIARPGISRDGSSVKISSSNRLTVEISTKNHVGLNEYKLYAEGNAVLIDELMGALTDEFTITEFSNKCKEVVVGFSKAKVNVTADLPSSIISTLGMFRYCERFNSDISHWDVSNVTNMDYMFHYARTFNQDLSKWCVSNIPSLPLGFDLEATAWTLPKPVWGTCPSDVPTAIGDTLEFTIDPDSTISPNSKFIITLGNAGDNWTLANESGVIATPTDREQDIVLSGGVPSNTLTIENLVNRSGKYILTTTSDRIDLRSGSTGDSGPVNMRVNVSKFSDTVNSYGFMFPTALLTVPTTLPSSVTNCEEMFYHCKHFDQDISMWDMGNVTNMTRMFNHAQSFNQSLNTWDVSSVVTMESMFLHAYKFNGEMGNWNTGNVTNMRSMLNAARTFNQPIGEWDVSKVTNMDGMFFDTPEFNQDLSTWCVTNIIKEPPNFVYYDNVWTLPKPIWGTAGKSSEKYLPIDATGESGVYITLSRDGVNYTTFDMTDPSFNQLAFQRFAVVGDDDNSFAFVGYPDIIAPEDLLPEDATHGLVLCGLTAEGKVITPRHPAGYTLTRGIVLDPNNVDNATEVSSPPLKINKVNSTIYAKATPDIPKEYDMFYSLNGAVEGGVVKVISKATISFD